MKVYVVIAVIAAFVAVSFAQSTKSWKLWAGPKVFSIEGPQLYKVQDGTCSIYVLLSDNGHGENVAIATGQGCH